LNLGQFWGGEWQSQWIVDIPQNLMTGSIKVNNHYFEFGNMAFNLVKKFDPVTLSASDGQTIVAKINEIETKY
jgi:hypothetical protein